MTDRATLRQQLIHFQLAHQYDQHEAAEIGRADGTVPAENQPGHVYVRIFRAGGGVTETTALNTRVDAAFGLKVWVHKNIDGVWAIDSIREQENVDQHGTSAALLTVPSALTRAVIPAARVGVGKVAARVLGTGYTMSVYVYPFTYESAGRVYAYGGGWYDLTSHIPASSGQRRLALVCLDPATHSLTARNGPAVGLAVPLTTADLASFDYGDLIPLAGVILTYGMTAVDQDSLILDARPWFTGVETAASGSSGTGTWNPDLAPASPHASDDEFDDEALDVQWAEYDAPSVLTVTETAGGALRLTAADHTDEAVNAVWMTPPDATYTVVIKCTLVTTAVWDLPDTDGYPRRVRFGLVAAHTGLSTGKCLTSGLDIRQTTNGVTTLEQQGWGVANWADPASPYSATRFVTADPNGYTWYLRLRRSPTDTLSGGVTVDYLWRCDFSYDGLTWYTALSYGDSTFDEAAKIGVFLSNWHSGQAVSVDFEFFRYRTTFDAVTAPVYGQSVASVTGHTHVEADVTDLDHTDAAAVHDNVSGEIAAVTEKAVLVAADLLLIEDSAASNAKKKAQVGNLPLIVSTADVSTPPTDAELDSAFGTPATVGAGFTRLINDAGGGAALYLVASDGTNWWHWAGTKAT